MLGTILGPLLTLTPASPAPQEIEFAESFSGGSNVGAWSWGTGGETVVPLNGNPGAYLQDLTLSTFVPRLGTFPGSDSAFTGDWAARGVTRVGVDLIVLDTDFGIGERPLTLELLNDGGTPFAFGDDWGAYLITDQFLPDPGVPIDAGWQSYEVPVPSRSPTLPPGWVGFGGLGAPGGPTFADLMRDVDRVAFAGGDPALFYLLNAWDVGGDNPRIAVVDCDGDGVADFEQLAAGAPDLDGDGALDLCQDLRADAAELSLANGGSVHLTLDAGPARAGSAYLLFGSLSGTTPGFPLGVGDLPLVFDAYTGLTLTAPNQPPLTDSFGLFDTAGEATAAFTLAPGSPMALAGLTAHHAYMVLDPLTAAPLAVSGSWPIALW